MLFQTTNKEITGIFHTLLLLLPFCHCRFGALRFMEKRRKIKCISGLPWDISTTTSGQTTSSATSAGTIFAFIIVHYVVTDFVVVVVVAVVLVVPKRDLQEGKSAIRNRCNQRKREWTNMFLYRCTHTHARTALCYCMCVFFFVFGLLLQVIAKKCFESMRLTLWMDSCGQQNGIFVFFFWFSLSA